MSDLSRLRSLSVRVFVFSENWGEDVATQSHCGLALRLINLSALALLLFAECVAGFSGRFLAANAAGGAKGCAGKATTRSHFFCDRGW